jgi:hypothetical protein
VEIAMPCPSFPFAHVATLGALLVVVGCASSSSTPEGTIEASSTPTSEPATPMRDANSQPQSEENIAPTGASPVSSPTWTVKRVGGDLTIETTGTSGDYRCAATQSRVDTELPEGYPAPTPPKAIELKVYPAARRAEVSGTMNPDMGTNIGFWPLFQHIQKQEIAMTSPVEMDYRDWVDQPDEAPGAWTMSFLYRTPEMGVTGADGNVRVVDTEPITMLAIGMNGPYRLAVVRTGLNRLREWLAAQNECEAVDDGDPRAMFYNDPSVPDQRKWLEVQIPVRLKREAASARSS